MSDKKEKTFKQINPLENKSPIKVKPEKIMMITLEHFRRKLLQVNHYNEKETLPSMINFVQTMQMVNKTPVDEIPELFESKEAFEFFQGKFLIHSAKYIFASKTFHTEEGLNFANHLLQQFMEFYNNSIEYDHPSVAELGCTVFDANRSYYNINNQVEQKSAPVKLYIAFQFSWFNLFYSLASSFQWIRRSSSFTNSSKLGIQQMRLSKTKITIGSVGLRQRYCL